MLSRRAEAAEAYVKALRTGEPSAASYAARFLAVDVQLVRTRDNDARAPILQLSGRDHVLTAITGRWPTTAVFAQGAWSNPREENGCVVVLGDFTPQRPASLRVSLCFNEAVEVSHIREEVAAPPPPQRYATLPDFVKALVNNALANDTPMVVAYVDHQGRPSQSLRGGVQTYSDTKLSIWLRDAAGGLSKAVGENPHISLLYRESRTRTTLVFKGRAHVANDERIRQRVFDLLPEVEQHHDPRRQGAALLVDLDEVSGTTVHGLVSMSTALGQ